MRRSWLALIIVTGTSIELFGQSPVPNPDAVLEAAFDSSGLVLKKSKGHPYLDVQAGTKIGDALVAFSSTMKLNIGAADTASFKRKGVTIRWGKNFESTNSPREIVIATSLDDSSARANSFSEKTATYAVAGRTGDAIAVTIRPIGLGLGEGEYAIAIAGAGITDGVEKGGDAEATGQREAIALAGRGRGNGPGGDARATIAPGGTGASAFGGDGGGLGGRGGDTLVALEPPAANVVTGPLHAEGGRGLAIGARGGHASAFNSDGIAEAVGGDAGEGADGGSAHAESDGEAHAAGGNSSLSGTGPVGGAGGFAIAHSVNSLARALGGNGGQGFFGGPGGRAYAESDHAGAIASGGIGGAGVFGGPGGNGVAEASGGTNAYGEGGAGGLCLLPNGAGGPGGRGYAAGNTLAVAIGGAGGNAPVSDGTGGSGGDVMGQAAAGAPLVLAPGPGGIALNPGGPGVVRPFVFPPPPGF